MAVWTTDGTATGDLTEFAPVWLGNVLSQGQDDVFYGRHVDLEADLSTWQTLLQSRLDVMIDDIGFDGVFLDDILRYYSEYFSESSPGESIELSARNMRDLVINLSEYAKAKDPDFFVIVNGAPYITGDTGQENAANDVYIKSIDAILTESYFSQNNTVGINHVINTYGNQGVVMLALEANNSASDAQSFYSNADNQGFIPYASSTGYTASKSKIEVGHF